MPLNNQRCQHALDRLTTLHPKLIDLGLERTLLLSQKMGAPHRKLPPTIHIAGTNGKGSTAAILRALLEAHGYSVHVYASPHLCRFNERIRLNGTLISDDKLADVLERVEDCNAGAPVTFFESTTIAAFTAFAEAPADFLILETGLGGRFDSTNIIESHACSIITPIAQDHEHFLGNRLGDIADAKAGIIKRDCPTIWAAQDSEALETLTKSAALQHSGRILIEGRDFTSDARSDHHFSFTLKGNETILPAPSLFGRHQIQNAGLAYCCMTQLGIEIDPAHTATGMQQAQWPARVQKLETGALLRLAGIPELWLDGAHNAHGASALAEAISALSDKRWIVIFGALDTRPAEQFLAKLKDNIAMLYCLTIPDSAAALPATRLSATANAMGISAKPYSSIEEVMQDIKGNSDGSNHPVLACGSLYLAGHLLEKNQTLPE